MGEKNVPPNRSKTPANENRIRPHKSVYCRLKHQPQGYTANFDSVGTAAKTSLTC